MLQLCRSNIRRLTYHVCCLCGESVVATLCNWPTAHHVPFCTSQDASTSDVQRGAAFGVYAGATLVFLVVVVATVVVLVVSSNTYNYKPFALVMIAITVLLMGHTWSYYPETLRKQKVQASARVSVCEVVIVGILCLSLDGGFDLC